MKAQNEKTGSFSFKLTVTVKRTAHRPWLKWIEIALAIGAIAVHAAALLTN